MTNVSTEDSNNYNFLCISIIPAEDFGRNSKVVVGNGGLTPCESVAQYVWIVLCYFVLIHSRFCFFFLSVSVVPTSTLPVVVNAIVAVPLVLTGVVQTEVLLPT